MYVEFKNCILIIFISGHRDMVWSVVYSRTEKDLFVSVSQVGIKINLFLSVNFSFL